ncbi:hypothetical protein GGR58DRAFT_462875 [Xylaria digitata]|nr:hypothetical protein GGR58DRAFT_462875 [Xylaria digitata]
MTSLRFPKIGTIVRNGEVPDIGGPFNCATSFFEAWAEHTTFPLRTDRILEMMKGVPAQQVLAAINEFPSRIKCFG